ncbi:MAG: DUF2723 domain-containing protein [Anaerolineae bacterium]|nr:DUF2723 domain-containing protein [Anaerolineae bacterium]
MEAVTPTPAGNKPTDRLWFGHALVAICGFVAGLALSRLLFEGLFPAWSWLGRPFPALVLAIVAAVLSAWGGAYLTRRWGAAVALTALPLLLNVLWLLDPAVNLARGRFLFVAGWWLAAVVLAHLLLSETDQRWQWLGPLFIVAALAPIYLLTMSHAVGEADAFEFQVVAPQLGIAHPTGYPLYLLLGKLFSLLPSGTMAWRINLASAVYAVLAAAVVFRLGRQLLRRPLAALAGAALLGLLPVYWSQAIIAEVYTLHALIVASALLLMLRLIDNWRWTAENVPGETWNMARDRKTMVALAFLLGLGLTNHLTTVFLLPPAALAILINLWPGISRKRSNVSRRRSLIPLFLQLLLAFLLPLLLYAYLPLRWAALNGEPMGMGRFVDWVVAGRFHGALQWGAWLHDPTRRQIVARLFLDEWGWVYLSLAAIGLGWLFARRWRVALVLLAAAAGFTFYALNYYVPDLAVFLIPAHVVVAVWVAVGLAALGELAGRALGRMKTMTAVVPILLFLLVMLPAIRVTSDRWHLMNQSGRDGGETWARGVLALPLARRAAVLADSEKIAPLYYLQQTERLRPDLDIMVLPDEAAYRTELDVRLAAGRAVYLARYLPRLEGVYYLRSAGPLVEVDREPLTELPIAAAESDLIVGPLRLLGYQVEPVSTVDPDAAAITLYWTLDRPLAEGETAPVLSWRWGEGDLAVSGRHPVNDTYPVNAWRPGEIVVDYHLLPLPDVDCDRPACPLDARLAIAPRFTPVDDLAWQTIATVPASPRPGPAGQALRMIFDNFVLDGLDAPATVRLETPLSIRYSGRGDEADMRFMLAPEHAASSLITHLDDRPQSGQTSAGSIVWSTVVEPAVEEGPHVLIAFSSGGAAICGWLARPTAGCVVAPVDISGVPLPEGATNFDDKIALLAAEVDWGNFAPGGQLPVTIVWQGLSQMAEDYTVFVQVLDASDRIVGQVDAWPVQGTRPTSSWRPGEVVTDPYFVQINSDIPPVQPGDSYEVHIGLYLLATLQRLPTLDEEGNPMGDHIRVRASFD